MSNRASRSVALVFVGFALIAALPAAALEKVRITEILTSRFDDSSQQYIEIATEDFSQGIGPKLRQMLIRGVGVHHAGVLPRYKQVVEDLFLKKLIPFVICTETLAAGMFKLRFCSFNKTSRQL